MKQRKKTTPKSGTLTVKKTVPSANPTTLDNDNFLDEFTKVRRMSLQLYCSPDRWAGVLLNAQHYAYVYHDKDKNDDGTLKKPHYHLLLVFENARYRNAVYKLFDLEGTDDTTINFQKLKNTKQSFQYLRHNTADAQKAKKYLYDPSEIVCDDINYWEDITSPDTTPNEDFITDLSNLSIKDMALRYGRDYIKNFQRYDTFKRMLEYQDNIERKTELLTFSECILQTTDSLDPVVLRAVATCMGECAMKMVSYAGFTKVPGGLVPTAHLRDVVNDIMFEIEDNLYTYLKEVYGE